MQHNSLFVFDIETIPDHESAKNLIDGLEGKSKEECRQALTDYHLKITDGKNDFLRQPFHKIVAISFLQADIIRGEFGEKYVLNEIRSGGNIDSNEEELVRGFFTFLKKHPPRIVSFNGRFFDLPVLKYRAIKYEIAAPWLYQMGDKWNNYSQKFSLDWHCDLIDGFSDFGASAKVKMNELCAAFGLPGKIGVDGSMVSNLHDNNKISQIRDYCETDVINTYLLYLHFQHHRGFLNDKNFNQARQDLGNYLASNSEEKPHFKEFLEEWLRTNKALNISNISN